ncbi:MAG: hypothetical protein SP1CHLAM54_04180 [Chlamydiia bacterium]|nr:hypothetical protein [Chlamydiia bacterium]MCH9615333.1 hypothetical protein [Chlamydiia bacterium]MCH9628345.1 hypothetical protein [Chlamydiia bacterium]
MKKLLVCLLFLTGCVSNQIDVVIPSVAKDKQTLNQCIRSIKRYGQNVRRVIVVSPERLTEEAEWFDEKDFPFSYADCKGKKNPPGWIFQQLLKLYAPITIPGLKKNVLILDSDVIFYKSTKFVTSDGAPIFTKATEHTKEYFRYIDQLIPGLKRQIPEVSGVAHHMLFQKDTIEALFAEVKQNHGKEPWKAMIDLFDDKSSLSEYELYFNYTIARGLKHKIRDLAWENSQHPIRSNRYKKKKVNYVAYHSWMRQPYTIAFVHIGEKLPPYIEQSVGQARLFNPNANIVLIGNRKAIRKFNHHDVTRIYVEDLEESPEHKQFLQNCPKGAYWRYGTERFFYLYEFMKTYDIPDLIHMETDVLLYRNLTEIFPLLKKRYKGMALLFDAPERGLGTFVYIQDPNTLKSYFDLVVKYPKLNDMYVFAKMRNLYPKEIIDTLPTLPEDHEMDSVFDAAAIGQYFGGVDQIHRNTHTAFKFVNETSVMKPDHYSYIWEKDRSGRNVPYLIDQKGKKWRINNLHIHSKDLRQFMSYNKEAKWSSEPFISGDTFRNHCDLVFDEAELPFLPSSVLEGEKVFVKVDYLPEFIDKIHPKIQNPYVLVTHNGDRSVPGKFAHLLNDPKIMAWFGQNADDPRIRKIPIGIANRVWEHGNIERLKTIRNLEVNKEHLFYMNFRVETCPEYRKPALEAFIDKPYCTFDPPGDSTTYLINLKKSKFVVSPRGNGYDCHRTWEALLLGCYPVCITSPLDSLYDDLPVVIVNDWSEVTEEFLNQKYEEFQTTTFNWAKIEMPYWLDQLEKITTNKGNL